MNSAFDFRMSCPCDDRLASIVHDIVRQAAKESGRDEAAAAAMAASVDDFLNGVFAAGPSQPPIQVHVSSDAIELQAAGRTMSLAL
jgi:hypothetical protein